MVPHVVLTQDIKKTVGKWSSMATKVSVLKAKRTERRVEGRCRKVSTKPVKAYPCCSQGPGRAGGGRGPVRSIPKSKG